MHTPQPLSSISPQLHDLPDSPEPESSPHHPELYNTSSDRDDDQGELVDFINLRDDDNFPSPIDTATSGETGETGMGAMEPVERVKGEEQEDGADEEKNEEKEGAHEGKSKDTDVTLHPLAHYAACDTRSRDKWSGWSLKDGSGWHADTDGRPLLSRAATPRPSGVVGNYTEFDGAGATTYRDGTAASTLYLPPYANNPLQSTTDSYDSSSSTAFKKDVIRYTDSDIVAYLSHLESTLAAKDEEIALVRSRLKQVEADWDEALFAKKIVEDDLVEVRERVARKVKRVEEKMEKKVEEMEREIEALRFKLAGGFGESGERIKGDGEGDVDHSDTKSFSSYTHLHTNPASSTSDLPFSLSESTDNNDRSSATVSPEPETEEVSTSGWESGEEEYEDE